MNLKYLFITSLFIVIVMILLPEFVASQPSFPDSPEQIPVDGGLALLFAAGSGFAIKKYRQKKNLRDHHQTRVW